MREIQKYNTFTLTPQIKEELSNKEIEVYRASFMSENNRKLRNMNGETLLIFALSLQTMANDWLGLKEKTVDDNKAAIRALRDALLEYPYLNEDEVKKIVKMGLKGELGKDNSFVHFSASNLCKWIEEYLQTVKLPVVQRIDYLPESAQEKPELSMKEQMDSKFCILYDALQQVASRGEFIDHGDILYKYLSLVDRDPDFMPLFITYEEDTKLGISRLLYFVVGKGDEFCKEYLNRIRECTLAYLEYHG